MAVYALTPEEGTPLFAEIAAGRVTLPGDEAVLELLAAAEEALRRRGLRRYEISNYAVPGEESRHNLGYWRLQPYLGVGPGAASTLFEGSGCGEPPATTSGALRLHGVEDITTYIRGHRKRYQGERITPVELLEEQLLMGLRTAEGVPLARLERRFGLSPAAVRGAIAAVPAPVTGERILTVEERPKPALHVPASDWNILDRAVLSAVEALLPLLGEPY